MATIKVTNTTTSSLTCAVGGINSLSSGTYGCQLQWYIQASGAPQLKYTQTLTNGVGQASYTFTGLSSATTYQILVVISYNYSVEDSAYLNTTNMSTQGTTLTSSYYISATSNNSSYGNTYASANGNAGTFITATAGTTVWVYANPYTGYTFSGWSSNVTLYSYSDTSAYFIMPSYNVSITANYASATYTVIALSNDSTYGSTYVTDKNGDAATTFSAGATVLVTADAQPGYKFSNWTTSPTLSLTTIRSSDDYVVVSFTMPSQHVTIQANYVATYTATVASSPTNGGSTSFSDGTTSKTTTAGKSISIRAEPATGYKFSSWSVSPANAVTITSTTSDTYTTGKFSMPSKNITITAVYTKIFYTVTVSANPTGGGSPYTTDASGDNAPSFSSGETVCIYASTATRHGYVFNGWTSTSNITFTDASAENTSFTMPASNVSITANYKKSRPDKFSWTNAKIQNQTFNLTADEWNGLCANINLVRVYKGLTSYSFTKASTGSPFYASMYNQAVNAIQGISGYGAYLTTVLANDPITAEKMNLLVSELNAIP